MQNQLIKCQGLDSATLTKVPYRREIQSKDMDRMRIPVRYWSSKYDEISSDGGNESLKHVVGKYIANMQDMRKAGCGLVIYGDNGVGKSCSAVVIAKEYRRRGSTVLFIEAADLKRMVVQKEHFDEDETYWERAKDVDVLVVDDFGKGVMDSTGFGATLFDELIRTRSANKRVTIITSNTEPPSWISELDIKKSTVQSLRECAVAVQATGENKRIRSEKSLRDVLMN